jgi:hypothetical protein
MIDCSSSPRPQSFSAGPSEKCHCACHPELFIPHYLCMIEFLRANDVNTTPVHLVHARAAVGTRAANDSLMDDRLVQGIDLIATARFCRNRRRRCFLFPQTLVELEYHGDVTLFSCRISFSKVQS